MLGFGGFDVIVVQWTSKKRDACGKLCFAHKINCLYVIVVVVVASVLSDYLVYGNTIFFPFCYSIILNSTHPTPKKENNQTALLMIANYTCT